MYEIIFANPFMYNIQFLTDYNTTVSTSHDDEVINVHKIRKDLNLKFCDVAQKIKQALIKNNTNVSVLIEKLQTYYSDQIDSKPIPLFDDDVFIKVDTIESLWKKLSKLWNIYDYDLLELIIELSECEEATQIFEDFKSKINLSMLEKEDMVLQYKEVEEKGSLKQPMLRVKVAAKKITPKFIQQVKQLLSKTFDFSKYHLHCVAITEGCVEINFRTSTKLLLYIMEECDFYGRDAVAFAALMIISI